MNSEHFPDTAKSLLLCLRTAPLVFAILCLWFSVLKEEKDNRDMTQLQTHSHDSKRNERPGWDPAIFPTNVPVEAA